MATATRTRTRTLALSCPKCGASGEPMLDLNLNSLDEITCGECSETFSAREAADHFAAMAARWQAVAAWIDSAPTP